MKIKEYFRYEHIGLHIAICLMIVNSIITLTNKNSNMYEICSNVLLDSWIIFIIAWRIRNERVN